MRRSSSRLVNIAQRQTTSRAERGNLRRHGHMLCATLSKTKEHNAILRHTQKTWLKTFAACHFLIYRFCFDSRPVVHRNGSDFFVFKKNVNFS